ncbi:MAG TPA: hypothetical protein VK395_08865 [Gemmataceae bacterium]|nr:hypothetical protein [Gemmataceae bacterium]
MILVDTDHATFLKYPESERGRRLIGMGTMDLKIAAVALVNNALLLSANLRDFRRVPGLRTENWLD